MYHINKMIKQTMYVIASPAFLPAEGELTFDIDIKSYDSSKMAGDDILVETLDIEHLVDGNFDLKGKQLIRLEAEMTEMVAKHYIAKVKLQEEINSLLAIEHDNQ